MSVPSIGLRLALGVIIAFFAASITIAGEPVVSVDPLGPSKSDVTEAISRSHASLISPQDRSPSPITAEAVKPHIQFLASPELEGRGTFRGKRLAIKYIVRHFEKLGLKPLFEKDSFLQEIPGPRTADKKPTIAGHNIGGWLPGSDPQLCDEIIIISAHFDHLGIRDGQVFPGADDNAGSVAMLLEVAGQFVNYQSRPRRSIAFLSCDLEENLLWGSRWFVAHPPCPLQQIKLFVTAEMIGRTLGDLPLNTIFAMGSEHATGLKDMVDATWTPPDLEVAHLGIDLIGNRSDYGPFRSESIPFLFFSGGEHPDYHRPTDTADRVDCTRVANVSNLILDVCRQVAQSDTTPLWTDKPSRDMDELRTLNRITNLLLQADDIGRTAGKPRLSDFQRFTVSNVHIRTAQIIERGTVNADERPWLIRSAQLLLLTVF